MNKDSATNIGKKRTNSIECFIPLYTPSISQQAILSKQILDKVPTELQFVARSVFMKEVNSQNEWTFELGLIKV